MLNTAFFQGNRNSLIKLVGEKQLLVITANGLMQRSTDTAYSFRQDSNFFYLTGVQEPNLVLVIDTSSGEAFFILPKQTEVERYFGGTTEVGLIRQQSGVDILYESAEGWNRLRSLLANHLSIKTMLAPPTQFTRQERMFSSPARRLLIQKLRRVSRLPIEGLQTEFMNLRQIKQAPEIAAIQRATEVTKHGFITAKAGLQADRYEYEIEALFDYEFKRRQANHGYAPPIIASGKNATALHYGKASSQIQSNSFVLMDVGAELDCYSADITRTYSVGQLSRRQKDVYQAVETVHQYAQSLLKPGLLWRDYVLAVDNKMGTEMLRLRLITQNTRSQIRPFFPHGISHSLGLDIHDICDYKIIQENMVITIEPGIYIPNEGIGVRIEDDILLTKSGSKNLSASIPY